MSKKFSKWLGLLLLSGLGYIAIAAGFLSARALFFVGTLLAGVALAAQGALIRDAVLFRTSSWTPNDYFRVMRSVRTLRNASLVASAVCFGAAYLFGDYLPTGRLALFSGTLFGFGVLFLGYHWVSGIRRRIAHDRAELASRTSDLGAVKERLRTAEHEAAAAETQLRQLETLLSLPEEERTALIANAVQAIAESNQRHAALLGAVTDNALQEQSAEQARQARRLAVLGLLASAAKPRTAVAA